MSISTRALPGTSIDPLYPDSDGEPLGETQFHILAIMHVFEALKQFFRGRDDICVLADSFMYYEQANRIKSKAPDVMVAFGVRGNHLRRSFRIAEEGVVPSVIFEMTSKKTSDEDEHGKKDTYEWLGVKEYFLFDPENMSIELRDREIAGFNPQLRGFRLHAGRFVAQAPDAHGRFMSRELGMLLEVEDTLLRLIDTRTGRRLLTFDELYEAADEAERKVLRAQQEADEAREEARQQVEQARQQADEVRQEARQQADEVREEARQQVEQARQQAEQARQQAEQARQQAEDERRRKDALEAEIAKLRAEAPKPAEE